MSENFNPKEKEHNYQGWSFKQICGMLRYNPEVSDKAFLIQEIEARRGELNSEEEIIVAVRNQIGRLFSGEIEIKNVDDIARIEDEISKQFPKVNESRYKGMVAETILAVLQEWNFRKTKKVYTEEDEKKLSSSDKEKLRDILYSQHVKTGITGRALISYKPKSNVSELLEKIAEPSDLTLRVIYGIHREKTDFNEERSAETQFPEDISSLIKIIQDSKQDPKIRNEAGDKILSIFKEAVSTTLGFRWLADFNVYVEMAFDESAKEKVNKWQKLSENLKKLISDLENGIVPREGTKLERDFVMKYQQLIKGNSRYAKLVEAILAGCQRYALDKQMSEHASGKTKEIYLSEMRDILEFEVLGDWLKSLILNFETPDKESSGQGRSGSEADPDQKNRREAGVKSDELPREIEQQRNFLMDKVKRLENNNAPLVEIYGFYNPSEYAKRELKDIIDYLNNPNCNKELAREIFARLRLYHSYQVMNLVKSSKISEVIRSSLSVQSRRFLLDEIIEEKFIVPEVQRKKDTEVIFSIPGVSEAFLLLQIAETGGSYNQKSLIKEMENKGFDTDTAKEALRLAKMYYVATGEELVRDYDSKKSNLSRLVYFAEWRRSRSANDRGPSANVNNIESLGITSYLRSCKTEKGPLFLPEEDLNSLAERFGFNHFSISPFFFRKGSYINEQGEKVLSHQPYLEAREAFCRRNWGVDIKTGEAVYVDPSKLPLSEIKEGEYSLFLDRLASAHDLAEVLLISDYNPGDWNSDKMQQVKHLVQKVDPSGFLNINFWLVYAITHYLKQYPQKWADKEAVDFYTSLKHPNYGLVSEEQLKKMLSFSKFLLTRLRNAFYQYFGRWWFTGN